MLCSMERNWLRKKRWTLKKGKKLFLLFFQKMKYLTRDESSYSYATAIKSGAFNYLFQEGEEEYNAKDCKINFK